MILGLGELKNDYELALANAAKDYLLMRIWQHDHTLWSSSPSEITNRLGWLNSPEVMRPEVENILRIVDQIISEGYTKALLLGMGGSSLAPEVFRRIFGVKSGFLDLEVLDSTDPGAVNSRAQKINPEKTLIIVSTKSGRTVETLSLFKYFHNQFIDALDQSNAGKHFIAITDTGSDLEAIAKKTNFRHIFLNDPNIGGRFSALSFFGLVPAALIGVDLEKLLDRAANMVELHHKDVSSQDAPGVRLGLALGVAEQSKRDKATFILPTKISPFGTWVEQLIAESTGKSGKGILPVISEDLGDPTVYSQDRVFIAFHKDGEKMPKQIETLTSAGHPSITLSYTDEYDIGGQFFLWEVAIAVAGYQIGIQPFNQPNVESSKINTRQFLDSFINTGDLPEGEFAPFEIQSIKSMLSEIKTGDYVSIQVYMQPSEYSYSLLQKLRIKLRDKYKVATTLGYGPRFLHSTGQMHKGDRGNGHFIQFVTTPQNDVPIPDEVGKKESNISFGVLIKAQALGDAQALRQANRPLISFLINEKQLSMIDEWVNEI